MYVSIAININLFDHFLFYIEMFMYTEYILVTIRTQMIYSHAQRCGKNEHQKRSVAFKIWTQHLLEGH